jgi:hypothetical protein
LLRTQGLLGLLSFHGDLNVPQKVRHAPIQITDRCAACAYQRTAWDGCSIRWAILQARYAHGSPARLPNEQPSHCRQLTWVSRGDQDSEHS